MLSPIQRDAGWCNASGKTLKNHHGAAGLKSPESRHRRVLPLQSEGVQASEEPFFTKGERVVPRKFGFRLFSTEAGAFLLPNPPTSEGGIFMARSYRHIEKYEKEILEQKGKEYTAIPKQN